MISVAQFFLNLLYRNSDHPLKEPEEIVPVTIQPVVTIPVSNQVISFPAIEKDLPVSQRIAKRQYLYDTMTINQNIVSNSGKILIPNIPEKVRERTSLMISNKARYKSVAHVFSNLGLKWWLVGLLHEMEGQQNFNTYLGNGQRLDKVTTIVPKGRGPFKTFKDGAIDAIEFEKLDQVTDWRIGNLLYIIELYNGFGYAKWKGINTPYLWSGSNQYKSGKYVKDGVYIPNEVSQQIGVALLIKDLDAQGQLS